MHLFKRQLTDSIRLIKGELKKIDDDASTPLHTSATHYDWYFPNTYPNNNSPIKYPAGSRGLEYSQRLVKKMLTDDEYLDLYLNITSKYFQAIGIDFKNPDQSNLNIGSNFYLIRLAKIVQSYQIFTQEINQFGGAGTTLSEKHREIQRRMGIITAKFNSLPYEFRTQTIPNGSDFNLFCLQDCFRKVKYVGKTYTDYVNCTPSNGLIDFYPEEKFILDENPSNTLAPAQYPKNIHNGNFKLREYPLQLGSIMLKDGQRLEVPAPAFAPYLGSAHGPAKGYRQQVAAFTPQLGFGQPAPAFSAARTSKKVSFANPLATEYPPTNDKIGLMLDRSQGAIYGQAIGDAMGLTTEFMSRSLAKEFLSKTGIIKLNPDGSYKTTPENLTQFTSLAYQIRDPENYKKIANFQNTNPEFREENYYSGFGDLRSCTDTNGIIWRQFNPHGSFTDDTDQAVLKFNALEKSGGNIEQAIKLYAEYIDKWRKNDLQQYFKKNSFGLGTSTSYVIRDPNFLEQPQLTSQRKWQSTPRIIPQANGALMSSSYILQFYPDNLELALYATEELAKVTHYDPAVSAHCVAFVTMLYLIQHHPTLDIDEETYNSFLKQAYDRGEALIDQRKEEYQELFRKAGFDSLESFIYDQKCKLYSAIYSRFIKSDQATTQATTDYTAWEDLDLTNPNYESDQKKSQFCPHQNHYDDIGMSHRCLAAGFFALKQLRTKITKRLPKTDAFNSVLIELMAQGGDADTNGTTALALCGCYIGSSNITSSLKDQLGTSSHRVTQEKILLTEICDISRQKITEHYQVEQKPIGLKVKPYFSKKIISGIIDVYDNFWHSQKQRGIDFIVDQNKLEDYTENCEFSPQKVYNQMAINLTFAKNQVGLSDKEALFAIDLARKYGGISNVENQTAIDQEINKFISVNQRESIPSNLKQKIARFSALFQKFNQDQGIFSGRENGKKQNGKPVGLRLTFINDAVISKWQNNNKLSSKLLIQNSFS